MRISDWSSDVCSSDLAVQVIERATGKVVAELPSGEDPEQFFLSRDGGTLFVANEDDAALTAIDLAHRTVAFQVGVGGEPDGVEQSPDGRWVAVTSEEENVVNWGDVETRGMVDAMPVDLGAQSEERRGGEEGGRTGS